MTRCGRGDAAGTNEANDAGSDAVSWRWSADCGRGECVWLEGDWHGYGGKNGLSSVGIIEGSEKVVCKHPGYGNCEPGGGEEEEGVREGEDG